MTDRAGISFGDMPNYVRFNSIGLPVDEPTDVGLPFQHFGEVPSGHFQLVVNELGVRTSHRVALEDGSETVVRVPANEDEWHSLEHPAPRLLVALAKARQALSEHEQHPYID